jgi:hypothetical protein
MAELVTIPISFLQFTVDYQEAAIRLLGDRSGLVQGIFDALKPWNPNIDDIELRATGKSSEQGVNFKLPFKQVSFFVGAAFCSFTRENVDWSGADETIAILDTAVTALMKLSGVSLGTKRTAIAVHLQPRKMHYMEILKKFIPPSLARVESQPATTMAVVVKWENRKVTIDGSGSIANAVFLRIERDFEAGTYAEIAQQLRKDEEELFEVLGVEEERA